MIERLRSHSSSREKTGRIIPKKSFHVGMLAISRLKITLKLKEEEKRVVSHCDSDSRDSER